MLQRQKRKSFKQRSICSPVDDLCSGKQINQCYYSTVDLVTPPQSRETSKPANSVLITILEKNQTHPRLELYLLAINGKGGMQLVMIGPGTEASAKR